MKYTSMKQTANKLCTKYGKPIYLRTPGSAVGWTKSFNVGQGRYQWTNDTTHEVVYVDPSSTPIDTLIHAVETKYEQEDIDGTTIQAGDRKFVSADVVSPSPSDTLLVKASDGTYSKLLTIVTAKPSQPGEEDGKEVQIVWTLQCR